MRVEPLEALGEVETQSRDALAQADRRNAAECSFDDRLTVKACASGSRFRIRYNMEGRALPSHPRLINHQARLYGNHPKNG